MTTLSIEDFEFVQSFLYREAGISLGGDKAYLVENRLGELCRTLGVDGVPNLLRRFRMSQCQNTSRQIVEAMTTNETSFFRDLSPFEALRTRILPDLLEARKAVKRLSIWSAACSTGQEPYSLSMTIDTLLGPQLKAWNIKILGTDLAEKVLKRAREGHFSQFEVNRGLPVQNLLRYFKKKGSHWEASETLKAMQEYQQVNLLNVPANLGTFDVIFCRNVLIYFDVDTKRKVLSALASHLAPDGVLFLGASEVLLGVGETLFERVNKAGAVCYLRK